MNVIVKVGGVVVGQAVVNKDTPLDIELAIDPAGETLPQTNIITTGGHLDVYKSKVALTGDVSVHVFSEGSTVKIITTLLALFGIFLGGVH